MSSRLQIAALGVMLVAYPLVSAAQVPQGVMGTWNQNVAKSTYKTGTAPKSSVVRWEAVPGGGAKVTVDTVDAAGKTTHNEIVTMFDGKATEYKGAAAPTTRVYSRIGDRDYQYVARVNGKVTTTGRATHSADGKTRTIVQTGTDADSKPVNTTIVYERQ